MRVLGRLPDGSADSEWVAWIQEGAAADGSTTSSGGSACGRVMLYSLATGTITQATDGMADVASVCWSADGKYRLYLVICHPP